MDKQWYRATVEFEAEEMSEDYLRNLDKYLSICVLDNPSVIQEDVFIDVSQVGKDELDPNEVAFSAVIDDLPKDKYDEFKERFAKLCEEYGAVCAVEIEGQYVQVKT